MTEKEFKNKIGQIIIITLKINNPFIRAELLKQKVNELCKELNLNSDEN